MSASEDKRQMEAVQGSNGDGMPHEHQKEQGRPKSSPLQALGRIASMSKYNGLSGVVQYVGKKNAWINFGPNVGRTEEPGKYDVKKVPISAFPNGLVQIDDHVTVHIGHDRDGDHRRLARRVLEGIGVLKQTTKVEAIKANVDVWASAQEPSNDPPVDQRQETSKDRGLMTRILYGLESVVSRVADAVSAVSNAVSALRTPPATAQLASDVLSQSAPHVTNQPAATLLPQPPTKTLQSPDLSVAVGKAAGVTGRTPDPVAASERAVDKNSLKVNEHPGVQPQPSKLPQPQQIQYETPSFKQPERGVRTIAFTSIPAPQPHLSVSTTDVPRRYAKEHDMPKAQRAIAQSFIKGPISIATESGEKAQPIYVRQLPQVGQRGKWAPEAGKEITPQARAKAGRSKADVRAFAVEQARKHANVQKAQEQGKQPER